MSYRPAAGFVASRKQAEYAWSGPRRYDKIVSDRSFCQHLRINERTHLSSRAAGCRRRPGPLRAPHCRGAGHGQRRALGETPPPLAIASIIDAAFWASLRREEGQAPKISLAFLPPEHARHPLLFARACRSRRRCCRRSRRPWSVPAFISACGANGDDFFVWGTTREVPAFCLVVEVVASGLIVVKHRSEPFGKFVNVAVLEGDQIKIVDEGVGRLIPDCPDAGDVADRRDRSPLRVGRDRGADPAGRVDAAAWPRRRAAGRAVGNRRLARLDRRAGALRGRSAVLRAGAIWSRATNADPDDLKRAVDAIAGLTAVDGATIINDRYDLLAFGAKITRAARQRAGRAGQSSPSRSKAARRRAPRRHCSAARVTCRPRSSCTISATRWRWSRRRTAASRSSSGRRANSSCTRTASTRCCL